MSNKNTGRARICSCSDERSSLILVEQANKHVAQASEIAQTTGVSAASTPTRDEFAAMAKRGTVHQDFGAEEDLANILKKSVPAVEFEIAGGSPLSEQYESGELVERLRERGLFVDDDRMGHVFVGTTPEKLTTITNAKTPFEFGRAYGYSDDDIAAFYVKRRGGDVDLGYAEYTQDIPREKSLLVRRRGT